MKTTIPMSTMTFNITGGQGFQFGNGNSQYNYFRASLLLRLPNITLSASRLPFDHPNVALVASAQLLGTAAFLSHNFCTDLTSLSLPSMLEFVSGVFRGRFKLVVQRRLAASERLREKMVNENPPVGSRDSGRRFSRS